MSFPQRLACALLLLAFTSQGALAQPQGAHRARSAGADTLSLLPRWAHPWFELGGDWLSAPRSMNRAYESGQAVGLGVSVRPMHRLELRTAFDFQTLQTSRTGRVAFLWGYDQAGNALTDTTNYTSTGRSWTMMLRPEVGVMPVRDFWFTGGAGGGYMNGGFDDALANVDQPVHSPVAMRNGWGWLWTAAVRWDIQPDPALPLGAELRTTSLKRGPDFVRTWAIRVTYRMPRTMRRGFGR